VSAGVKLQILAVSTLSSEICAICIIEFGTPKIFLEGYLFVEFVSELQITTRRMKIEALVLEFFSYYS
jgi:hypothetical protein